MQRCWVLPNQSTAPESLFTKVPRWENAAIAALPRPKEEQRKEAQSALDENTIMWALPGLRGGGGLIMRPGRQRGRRAGLCRAGGYCGRIERSPDRRAASPGKCRGAGVARSAATTRTLPGY